MAATHRQQPQHPTNSHRPKELPWFVQRLPSLPSTRLHATLLRWCCRRPRRGRRRPMDLGLTPTSKRRVMVVADPGRESAGALEWALYHAVLKQDEIILLYVEPPNASGAGAFSTFLRRHSALVPSSPAGSGAGSGEGGGEYEFLDAMRAACEAAQPKAKVHIERVEMEEKDKAATILMHTKLLRVDLLVIGQRRTQPTFLGCKIGGRTGSMASKGMDPAEFLIKNSKCLCVGVQKKGQNSGYLLNTKTHKNFWLLA